MRAILSKLALAACSLVAVNAHASNSLTFQGVTFNTYAVDADTIEFSILNATHATGNWTGASFLKAFELKGFGTEVLSGSIVSGPAASASSVTSGVNGSGLGCSANGGTNGICFSFSTPLALTDSMTWRIDLSANSALNFSTPHVKVQFLDTATDNKKLGDLLSQNLPVSAVPEPETYALLLAGLGLVGAAARRRKS